MGRLRNYSDSLLLKSEYQEDLDCEGSILLWQNAKEAIRFYQDCSFPNESAVKIS